jgi:hypothetical protein
MRPTKSVVDTPVVRLINLRLGEGEKERENDDDDDDDERTTEKEREREEGKDNACTYLGIGIKPG